MPVPISKQEQETATTDGLCLCGCGELAAEGKDWAPGCYKRLGYRRAAQLQREARVRKTSMNGLVFRCASHPDWSTTDRTQRNHHFKREHAQLEKKAHGEPRWLAPSYAAPVR